MVKYNRAFEENVKGKAIARFKLDAQGNPFFRQGADGHKHYTIYLSVTSNNPLISNVTYKLDSSYYDPIRESDNRQNNFQQEITSYGDYVLTVEAQVGPRVYPQRALLSEFLEEGHKDSVNSPQIIPAINTIRDN